MTRKTLNRIEDIGIGLYSVPQAARIIGAPVRRIRRWVGAEPEFEAVINRSRPDSELLNFLELMELHFVHMFRSEGVSLQTIRTAADSAAKKFGTDHPFAVRRFDTDGRTIFATLQKHASDQEIVEDLARGQLVMQKIAKPFFRKLEYRESRGDSILRFWPMAKTGRVVLDPSRHFGQPIDNQTGVPTSALAEAMKVNANERKIADWFDVPVASVRAAVKFEQSLAT